ncbi:MAG: response regulator [Candidatus Peribacteraceae bacterium]|nr:response regulator [Candidatus Peribacteraceae bacterium]
MQEIISQKKVLLVEDDETMNMLLKKQLEKGGFAVETCFNGQEALDRMGKEAFDALLLDLLMPVQDGFAVLEKKKETLCASTPVYVLTNLGADATLQRARDMGATEVFVKTMTTPKAVIAKMKSDLKL